MNFAAWIAELDVGSKNSHRVISQPALQFTALLVASIPIFLVQVPIPIDETRYLGVAWEMWREQNFLVPHLNNLPYSHKPPLLFWLMHAGWWFLEPNSWWPRVVSLVAAFASLRLTVSIALSLWPDDRVAAERSAWFLLSNAYFLAFSTAIMFDLLLLVFILASLRILLAMASVGARRSGWILLVIVMALGMLTKGPVILLYIAIPVVCYRFWVKPDASDYRPSSFMLWFLLSVVLAVALVALWAIPAAISGGVDYADALLWKQTVNRVVNPFAHARPFWWYIPVLVVILSPWVFWPQLMASLGRYVRAHFGTDSGLRFVGLFMLSSLVLLSVLPSKQPHYLLPLIPAFSLLLARSASALTGAGILWPLAVFSGLGIFLYTYSTSVGSEHIGVDAAGWISAILLLVGALALVVVRNFRRYVVQSSSLAFMLLLVGLHAGIRSATRPGMDMEPVAVYIEDQMLKGRTVVQFRKYHGQFSFAGKMARPVRNICPLDTQAWLLSNSEALVITYGDKLTAIGGNNPSLTFGYRGKQVHLWRAATLLDARHFLEKNRRQVPREFDCKPELGTAPM